MYHLWSVSHQTLLLSSDFNIGLLFECELLAQSRALFRDMKDKELFEIRCWKMSSSQVEHFWGVIGVHRKRQSNCINNWSTYVICMSIIWTNATFFSCWIFVVVLLKQLNINNLYSHFNCYIFSYTLPFITITLGCWCTFKNICKKFSVIYMYIF